MSIDHLPVPLIHLEIQEHIHYPNQVMPRQALQITNLLIASVVGRFEYVGFVRFAPRFTRKNDDLQDD